ncbi:MAG: phage tail sheath subtilisin-like domain-containing protein [Acidobacteriia bacterium]|nr:phage tail sheath subtilisin-like domain-containing protein [Terriglobia bacterium]
MPEYLAPGVYVEEVSFRSKSIEGVSTSTAAFVGPALFGPTSGPPELLTSFADFERIYWGLDELTFADASASSVNYLAQGVRSFFDNGGQRLYVQRIYQPLTVDPAQDLGIPLNAYASATINDSVAGSPSLSDILLRARYPGGATGDDTRNLGVTFTFHVTKNVLAGALRDPTNPASPKDPVLRGVAMFDLVWISHITSPPSSPDLIGDVYWAERYFDATSTPPQWTWRFHSSASPTRELRNLVPGMTEVRVVTVGVTVNYPGAFPRTEAFQNLTFHPKHPQSLSQFFAKTLSSRAMSLTLPFIFDPDKQHTNGDEIARVMMSQPRSPAELSRLNKLLGTGTNQTILDTLGSDKLADTDRQVIVSLKGGSDGNRPTPARYEGEDDDPKNKTGLKSLEDISDISIVAAPGHSHHNDSDSGNVTKVTQISGLLISHAERMRYRISVLDSIDGDNLTDVRHFRAQLDSSYAAFYYPWIRIIDPISQNEINLPPSGFVAGLYAANDILSGVHKAPANMVVQGSIGFEVMLNKAQQDVLNPEGINAFRFFEGRGFRLWGARTVSSDPEWKYVNLRRYFAYLEHSIDRGTQWVVFENNSEPLWANVRTTVEDFLFNEFKSGHLMGDRPEQAYFVRCDRSTMTQNDFDNGRLICQIGVAPVRPAEFVIFRIGQWTGSARQS